jgi:hypothetical protein
LTVYNVSDADLYLIKAIKDVEFSQVDTVIAVNQAGVLEDHEVKPATSSPPARCNTKLSANLL